MASTSFLSIFAGAALLRIVTSCAAGDPMAAPVVDAGAEPEASVIPSPEAASRSSCDDGRWCAVTLPVTTPVSLNGIWGSAPNDVWLVGSPDLTLHWDGTQLTSSKANTDQTLFGVWGSGANDVWAFSAGNAIWHTDGYREKNAGWSGYRGVDDGGTPWSGAIYSMWGRSANDVWAVGPFVDALGSPTVWHCDGWHDGVLNWIPSPMMPNHPELPGSFYFNGIWGDGSDIWIVGRGGKTRYTDGWKDDSTTWTPVDSATTLDLYAVWGTGNGEVWVAGAGGVVRRFSRRPDGTYLVSPVDLPTRATIHALSGFGPDDIWAAGSDGTLAHWDGQTWSLVDAPVVKKAPNDLLAIWGLGPDDIWVAGQNTLLHKGNAVLPGTTP